jgi:hypothetical protein
MAQVNTNHLNITFKLPERTDGNNKRVFTFNVIRNDERNGKWLAAMIAQDVDGAIETIASSAWSNAAPAKRWCEDLVGRQISWVASDDGKYATANVELDYSGHPLAESVSTGDQPDAYSQDKTIIEDAEIVEE